MSGINEKDKWNHFHHDFAESVSFNEEISKKYLEENGVDVEKFISKGLKQIENTLRKKHDEKSKALFFKRVVLGAEIVNNLYNETTFGHVKLQKLMYLCEQVSSMELSTRYTKQAAGPYDAKFMHSVDKEFERQKWFDVEVTRGDKYNKYEYSPGVKIESYKKYFDNYYSESKSHIKWLIDTFGKPQTKKVELVATIYSCLEEYALDREEFSSDSLIQKVMSWSEEKKKKFTSNDVSKAHQWMIEKGLIPKPLTE